MAKKTDKDNEKAPKAKKAAKAPAKAAKAPAKAAKAAPAPKGAKAPRHPKERVVARHGGKAELAKQLAESLARDDEDTDVLAARLQKASNAQLLRLAHVSETVKQKFGDRGKLVAAISAAQHKAKDKDYLAKLDTYSLPHLLDLALATIPSRAASA
jgi:hypothetical protein